MCSCKSSQVRPKFDYCKTSRSRYHPISIAIGVVARCIDAHIMEGFDDDEIARCVIIFTDAVSRFLLRGHIYTLIEQSLSVCKQSSLHRPSCHLQSRFLSMLIRKKIQNLKNNFVELLQSLKPSRLLVSLLYHHSP